MFTYVKQGFLFLALMLISVQLTSTSRPNGSYPRVASYYLSAFPSSQSSYLVPALARYDVVILDMEMGVNNPTAISDIRQINPDIVILAYMTCEEISDTPPSPITNPLRYQLYNGIQPSWWLRNASGGHAVFWQGTYMLNCSALCPVVNGQTWNDYFANFVTTQVLSNDLWDGFFVDNCWSIVPWEIENVDCDNSGIADVRTWLDTQWEAGMNVMLSNLRSLNTDEILVGNGGYNYGQHLNGAMIEGWDSDNPTFEFGYDWQRFMDIYALLETGFQAPNFNVINAMNESEAIDYQHIRYTLTTALMGSAYYGIDLGPLDHSDTWWFDEYDCDLGQPLAPFTSPYSTPEPNELHNGTLDNNLAEWQIGFVGVTTGYAITNTENGNNFVACHITNTSGIDYSAQFMQINNDDLAFSNGERYVLTFKAKADQARPVNFVMEKHEADYQWVMQNAVEVNLTTNWQTYSYTITSTNTLYQPEQLRFTFNLGQYTGIVYFDDISLVHAVFGVAQREFENGLVLCNPSSNSQTVNLNATYYHLQGTQDSSVNNGQSCSSVTIAPQDGIILLNSYVDNNDNLAPVINAVYNYPNPFNQSTAIMFNITRGEKVTLEVFNIKGQKVNTLINEPLLSGEQTIDFGGIDYKGQRLPSGIYFYRLRVGNVTKTNKMVLIRQN
ncbi:MAG: putative glycoside hydrolase [Candidatus Cloacimonetes bacterium]|nr:putative glycoside hydrolase [Candidatus Cloacimonadota bacterium]